MGWVHDTGYDAAYEHEGWAATVLDDGSDASGWPLMYGGGERVPEGRKITGWRAACECSWRGPVWPRAEWPSEDGWPPQAVEEGPDGQDGCYGQWRAHLAEALPELAVHDTARRLEEIRAELDTAVITARAAGRSWDKIGTAAGMSRQSAHERWDHLVSAALEPLALDGQPQPGPLDSFGADIRGRAQLARRRYGGHPSAAWSTSERLAVALVLRDIDHLHEMGYTVGEAEERVTSGMHTPPAGFGGWLDRIRAELNTAQIRAVPQ